MKMSSNGKKNLHHLYSRHYDKKKTLEKQSDLIFKNINLNAI